MKNFIADMGMTLLLALLLSATQGCGASYFTANTTASATKDGFAYSSNKNQEALDAEGDIDPATGKMHFHVKTTASTPEAAIAAASNALSAATKAITDLAALVIPMAEKVAAGAAGVPVLPKPIP